MRSLKKFICKDVDVTTSGDWWILLVECAIFDDDCARDCVGVGCVLGKMAEKDVGANVGWKADPLVHWSAKAVIANFIFRLLKWV